MNKPPTFGIYLVVVAVTAIALTFLVMFPFVQQGPKESKIYPSEQLPDSASYIMRNFRRSLSVEGFCLNDVSLYTHHKNTSLCKLVQEPTLVFRFFETNCEPCINAELTALKECTADIQNKVLLVASYSTYKGLRAFLAANKMDSLTAYQMSPLDTIKWEPDKYESPYYFILYPGGKTSHFFMAVPDYLKYTKQYLEGVTKLLQ